MSRKAKEEFTDEEIAVLAKRFRENNAEAFRALYRHFNQLVYRFCYRMLQSEQQAKDAFQETFIKVYEHREDFRGGNFPAWLFSIARRSCLNAIRARKEVLEFNEDYHVSIFERSSDFELKNQIEKALSSLPEALREAFILREYEEQSYQEIAELTKIDVSLAKVRVFRARTLLRKLLANVKKEIYES